MSSFTKNFIKLFSGNVIGQVIIIGTMPLVTRIYSPEDFGFFSIFVSALLILSPASNLRLNSVILLPKNRFEALHLLALSCMATLGFSLLLFILAWIFMSELLTFWFPDLEKVKNYLWIIPIGVFLRGVLLNIQSWTVRQKKFQEIAVTNVLQSAVNRSFVLSTGLLIPLDAWGLIIGRLLGIVSGIGYLALNSLKGIFGEIRHIFSLIEMQSLTRRYKDFPLYGTWSVLLTTISREAPIIIIASLFSPVTAGLYALSVRTIRLPMIMIGQSLNKVFLQKAVSLREEQEKLVQKTIDLFINLLYLVLPITLILAFLGEWFFDLVFSNRWAQAGAYVQVLSPSFLFLFLYTPFEAFFVVFEKQRERLIFDLLNFFVRCGSLFIVGLLTHSPRVALLAMSVGTCIIMFSVIVYLFRQIGIKATYLIQILIEKLFFMVPLFIGLFITRLYKDPFLTMVILFFSLFIQCMIILFLDPALKEKVRVYLNI